MDANLAHSTRQDDLAKALRQAIWADDVEMASHLLAEGASPYAKSSAGVDVATNDAAKAGAAKCLAMLIPIMGGFDFAHASRRSATP